MVWYPKKLASTLYDLNSLHCYDNDIHSKICDKIINYIIDIDNFKVNEFREILYELLVYNIKISSSVWYILKNILKDKKYSKHITKIIQKIWLQQQF